MHGTFRTMVECIHKEERPVAEKATPSAQPDLRGLAERWAGIAARLDPAKGEADAYDRCARELRAALAGPEDGARSAWRPIESAPDERVIVAEPITGPSVPKWAVGEAEYFEEEQEWRWAGNHPTDVHGGPIYPTHWMPLPEPPVAAARPSGEQEGESK